MGGRGGGSARTETVVPAVVDTPAASPVTPAANMSTTLEQRIQAAIVALEPRLGELVSLVRLRHRLSDVERSVLDAELKRLDRARRVQLSPDPNQKALPPEARRDAVTLGGRAQHFVSWVR